MTDKERIATLLTALEEALEIADELTNYVCVASSNDALRQFRDLKDLKEFARLEREILSKDAES